jgi:hypothetical protein
MSFCRWRGRRCLGGIRESKPRDRTAFISTKPREHVSATARAKTAGNRQNYAVLNRRSHCSEGEDANAIRARLTEAASQIRERIGPWTKLKVLVAQDDSSFNEFPADLGWHGSRVSKYYR